MKALRSHDQNQTTTVSWAESVGTATLESLFGPNHTLARAAFTSNSDWGGGGEDPTSPVLQMLDLAARQLEAVVPSRRGRDIARRALDSEGLFFLFLTADGRPIDDSDSDDVDRLAGRLVGSQRVSVSATQATF
jgi:hypothetical protein